MPKSKNHTHPPKASLGVWPEAGVWERIHIDMLGPLPKTKDGYQYVLLVVDAFSKWPETFRLKGSSAIEVADVLYNDIFCRYGATKELVSDRGANFLSKVVSRLSKLFNIRRSTTSGYRPQCNATCEQFNRTILKCLRAYCSKQNEWDKYLQSIMYGYRATVSTSSTLQSPYRMMFGRDMILPIDIELGDQKSTGSAQADEYVKELVEKLKIIHEVARENEREYQEEYKKRYDKDSKDTNFIPGTIVWLKSPLQSKTGESKKLMMRYNKLVYIKEKLDNNTYIVIEHDTHKQIDHPVHSDRLKKYYNEKDMFPNRIDRGQEISDSDDEDNEPRTQRNEKMQTATKRRNVEKSEEVKLKQTETRKKRNMKREKQESKYETIVENSETEIENENKSDEKSDKQETSTREGDVKRDSELKNENVSKTKTENKKRMKNKVKNETEEEPVVEDERPWQEAEKLLATKMKGGKKYYRVKWTNENVKPTWELSSDVSEPLKIQFHINRTMTGRRRKKRNICGIRRSYVC